MGNRWSIIENFANPDVPALDDYYEPFDYDYEHLKNAQKARYRLHVLVR